MDDDLRLCRTVSTTVSPGTVARIDAYQQAWGHQSRAASVRALIDIGLLVHDLRKVEPDILDRVYGDG